jgi:diaminohydroxyphosphoribosylaminopyrimidine deaminase/5-amino-6-(5-phosphoribosylamino)uracil reductase
MARIDLDRDRKFMREALRLAEKGGRAVSPNPMVGAVLVRKGAIVSRGYHRYYGGPHAEVECLSKYAGELEGTTLYVTLEPCSHFGKTPPCAALLASSPITRIVVAMKDPNPLVSGRGIAELRRAGKRVDVGLMREEAELLNHRFIRAVTLSRPYVHVKVAQTLDGRIAVPGDRKRWITGKRARRLVHEMRASHDAVLVGAGTVKIDDPRLNVRGVDGTDPDVIVLDGKLSVPESARVFRSIRRRRVIVCSTHEAARRRRRKVGVLRRRGVEVLIFPGRKEKIGLAKVLRRLHQEEIGSVLVEGGGGVFGQFVAEGIIDELSVFVAPRLGMGGAVAFKDNALSTLAKAASTVGVWRVGEDILIHALFE